MPARRALDWCAGAGQRAGIRLMALLLRRHCHCDMD